MKPPVITYVAIWVQALPAFALALTTRRTRAGALIALGTILSLFANTIGWILADLVGNNMIVTYLSSPLTAVCYIWAMSDWQVSAREMRWYRRGAIGFVVVWAVLVVLVEDVRNFGLATGPVFSLTLLAIGTWTLLRRTHVIEAGPFTGSDWFWVSTGLAINGAATALSTPLGAILIERQRYDLFNVAWQVRAVLVTISYLFMSWGIYRGPAAQAFATDD